MYYQNLYSSYRVQENRNILVQDGGAFLLFFAGCGVFIGVGAGARFLPLFFLKKTKHVAEDNSHRMLHVLHIYFLISRWWYGEKGIKKCWRF